MRGQRLAAYFALGVLSMLVCELGFRLAFAPSMVIGVCLSITVSLFSEARR